jgi:signal transduction histidine kinase
MTDTLTTSPPLVQFWDVYQRHYAAIGAEVLAEAADHAEFGPIVAAMPPDVSRQQDEYNERLVDDAIRRNHWAPYAAYLRAQGAEYARAGISLASWIDLVASFSEHLRPYLLDAYATAPSELLGSLTGMSRFTNFAIAGIAEGYRDAERELILREERERHRADQAVAQSLERLRSMQLAAEALLDVSRHIEASTDLPTLYGRLSATIADLVQAGCVLFARVQEDGTLAAEPDAYGVSADVVTKLRDVPCDAGGQDLAGRIAHHDLVFRGPLGREDLFAPYDGSLEAFGASTVIAVAWRSGDRRLGILSAYGSRRPNGFTDDDAWVLRVAGLAAGLVWQHKQAEERERAAWRQEQQRVVQLQAVNAELEAFSYTVSHDLRAPLRAIDGFSRILLTEHAGALDDGGRSCLDRVRGGAQQMGRLIDDLLTFSRLGRQALNRRPILPSEIARRALDDLVSEQEGRRVKVDIADLPPCEADPALLELVFVNLLSNALKFTRRRPETLIQVEWYEHPDDPAVTVYAVRDNGVGFDMQYADRLFGVFQRLHRAEDYEGTGVGLAIVQRIVTRHGGRVWAEAAPGQGATVYFTLTGGQARD